MIDAAGDVDVPLYQPDTAAWSALPRAVQLASAARAAEVARLDRDPDVLAERLEAELAAYRAAAAQSRISGSPERHADSTIEEAA